MIIERERERERERMGERMFLRMRIRNFLSAQSFISLVINIFESISYSQLKLISTIQLLLIFLFVIGFAKGGVCNKTQKIII